MAGLTGFLPFLLYLVYMGDKINKEFENYQKDLETRNKKLKLIAKFEPDERLEEELKELKDKQITLWNH